MLQNAMQRLTEYPSPGMAVPQISSSLQAFPVGQHVIYYRFSDDEVTIRRLLHSQMDATTPLNPERPRETTRVPIREYVDALFSTRTSIPVFSPSS